MKLTLFTLTFFLFNIPSFCQEYIQLGDIISSYTFASTHHDIHVNNNGAIFICYSEGNGDIKMKKYISEEWIDSDNSLPIITSMGYQHNLDYNSLTNEFFIVYNRGGTIYFRSYLSSWSNETFVGTANNRPIKLCIDEEQNIAYFLYRESNNSVKLHKYDILNNLLEEIPKPQDFDENDSKLHSTDLRFNPKDDKLYLSGQISSGSISRLYRYDGTTWESFTTILESSDNMFRTKILIDTSSTYDISVVANTSTINGSLNKALSYKSGVLTNHSTLQNAYIFEPDGGGFLTSLEMNPINGYYAYSYNENNPDQPYIQFYDGTSWHQFDHDLENLVIKDIYFKDNGSLIVSVVNESDELYVYEYPLFYTSLNIDVISKANIFPNPCSEQLNISSTNPSEANLYDVSGKLVLRSEKLEKSKVLEVNHLESGIYTLILQDGNGYVQSKKVSIVN